MRKATSTFIIFGLLMLLATAAFAGTYTLTDGQTITGEPVSYDRNGVVLRTPSGSFAPRTAWSKFSQESLRQLAQDAKKPQDASYIEPFLEETVEEEQQIAQKEIIVNEPERVPLPQGKKGIAAVFSSPLGFLIFFLLYAANVYAGYEVALFRYRPFWPVIGVSAVLPILGPIIFLCLPPPRYDYAAQQAAAEAPVEEPMEEVSAEETAPVEAPVEETSSEPALPETITYSRGQFTFNRRFFETKTAGFLRVVPEEHEKDLLLAIKSLRGDFVGRRISKLTPAELHLLTFKGEATAEEAIPFNEIQEVQIRHKDSI